MYIIAIKRYRIFMADYLQNVEIDIFVNKNAFQ